ncbi:MAG: DUF4395 domain-containing protein [Actinomycetota bacterium]
MAQVTSDKSQTPAVTIDARGPRFGAAITTVVLAVALATQSFEVIAFQAIVFGIGAIKGPQFTPYAAIYRKFVRPRLKGEVPVEDVRPPQFAQKVGLGFAVIAVAGLIADLTPVFVVATGFALAAAFLNAAFDYCLGCEIYLLLLRFKSRK